MSLIDDTELALQCCCALSTVPDAQAFVKEKMGMGRPVLDTQDVTDVLSTGRKRAALMAPIFNGMECEWAGLSAAGGGVEPIMGCRGNLLAKVRSNAELVDDLEGMVRGELHHGPDKNVLNNTPGVNLHRICSTCHHRWHALNDKYYDDRPQAGEQMLPTSGEVKGHDPITTYTEEEYADWLLQHGYK
jgi:hypothetical protein